MQDPCLESMSAQALLLGLQLQDLHRLVLLRQPRDVDPDMLTRKPGRMGDLLFGTLDLKTAGHICLPDLAAWLLGRMF